MIAEPNSSEAKDIAYHLHGYTNAKKHMEVGPLVIERGEDIHVVDTAGNRYIEAMAGLWSTALGFSEKRLAQAAARRMKTLPFYHTFTHKSHGPVIDLAEKLIGIAPVPMSKAFFASSGSEGVDTALKLIWYRANVLGEHQRKKIIVRDRAYHGVTIASSCLTSLPGNHHSFDLIVPGINRLTCPHYWREAEAGESEEGFATRLAEELDHTILNEGPETIAAFFAEPVMGAGGVIVPPRTYWSKIQAILQKYDVLFVADEVICGFGRTGNMFGSQTYDLNPDMMVLSKQLSSSYLPLSALLINDRVFEPIADESDRIGTLGHGFTGGGHPVPAAVALETIRIIEEENLVAHASAMGERLRAGLHRLESHPLVGEVRGVGLLAAVELVTSKSLKRGLEAPGQLGGVANNHLQQAGVISRNMGDALAFCPPLIINESQVDDLLGRFRQALDATLASLPADSIPD